MSTEQIQFAKRAKATSLANEAGLFIVSNTLMAGIIPNKIKRPEGANNVELQAILNAMVDGIYLIDAEGYLTAVNDAWCQHTGLVRERIIGRHVSDVLHDYYFSVQCLREGAPAWPMREKEYEQAVSVRALREGKIAADFFEAGHVFSTATPILGSDGVLEGVLTLVRDVTSLPDYEEAQKREEGTRKVGDMIGQSPEMERIRVLIEEVAPTNATILIMGETGVGKEVVAEEIHRHSARADKPYLKINCAAIPENLVEAELFGYEGGAFTGATKSGKLGLFETADQGTVLLDEIGEFPLPLQPKLLRAIQERMITRVGGVDPIPIDIRILAATNQNLSDLVSQKKFREDLYYRLNVIPIHLPPLRTRGEDIGLLADNFLGQFNETYQRNKMLTRGALHVLQEYPWPGNIRELRNLIERLVVLGAEHDISAQKVQRFLSTQADLLSTNVDVQLTLKQATDRLQSGLIEDALLRYGSTYRAAAALGTSQSTLVRKARQLGIQTAEKE